MLAIAEDKEVFLTLGEPPPTMSPGSYFDAKEQVRQAINIVELVEHYFPLRRQGRNYVGLCPWHDDHRPSLQVNPERQTFRCWVCDIGGDIFNFVMQMEGVEFPEALAMLAERAGIELKPQSPGKSGGPSRKQLLYQALFWAEEQYHRCLLEAPDAAAARRYLEQRQIPQESIRRFRLGFAPLQSDWLLSRARKAGIDPGLLETGGILARSDTGRAYDRFRGRLLFSIRNPQGSPVGFGGRLLPEVGLNSPAKYVNSPETPLFGKSRLLYGLDLAREAMRKSNTALVMEGYTDCIMAHRFGFENAVAVLGTALGDEHIRLLNRFAEHVVLVLDGDEAGRRRTNEVLSLFVARGVDIRVLTLPEEMDPCDFLLQHGAEAFSEAIQRDSLDALDHAFADVTRDVDLQNDVAGVSRAVDHLLAMLAQAPRQTGESTAAHQAREWKIITRLSVQSRIDEDILRRRLKELRRGKGHKPPSRPAENKPKPRPADTLGPIQGELLELIVIDPGMIDRAAATIQPEELTSPLARRFYETALRLWENGLPPDFDRLMLELDDPQLKALLVDLDERAQAKEIDNPEELWQQWLHSFLVRKGDKERRALQGALRDGSLDADAEGEALRRLVEQQRNRQRGTSNPKDG